MMGRLEKQLSMVYINLFEISATEGHLLALRSPVAALL